MDHVFPEVDEQLGEGSTGKAREEKEKKEEEGCSSGSDHRLSGFFGCWRASRKS